MVCLRWDCYSVIQGIKTQHIHTIHKNWVLQIMIVCPCQICAIAISLILCADAFEQLRNKSINHSYAAYSVARAVMLPLSQGVAFGNIIPCLMELSFSPPSKISTLPTSLLLYVDFPV